MNALARWTQSWFSSAVTLQDKPLAEPELVCVERRMTGFFAGLTADQKRRALEYTGDDHTGDPSFPRQFAGHCKT
jgi:hypothetical protein